MEYTFSMIKPDITKSNLTGKVNDCLERQGLKIVAQKMMHLSVEQAKEFYAEHKERPFFQSLVEFISSGAVIAQVLKGEDAIKKNREIMGATNPAEAAEGTIRKLFAKNIDENSIHGSDSPESAKREISFFFSDLDLVE